MSERLSAELQDLRYHAQETLPVAATKFAEAAGKLHEMSALELVAFKHVTHGGISPMLEPWEQLRSRLQDKVFVPMSQKLANSAMSLAQLAIDLGAVDDDNAGQLEETHKAIPEAPVSTAPPATVPVPREPGVPPDRDAGNRRPEIPTMGPA